MTDRDTLTPTSALGVALSCAVPSMEMADAQGLAPAMLAHLEAMGFRVAPSPGMTRTVKPSSLAPSPTEPRCATCGQPDRGHDDSHGFSPRLAPSPDAPGAGEVVFEGVGEELTFDPDEGWSAGPRTFVDLNGVVQSALSPDAPGLLAECVYRAAPDDWPGVHWCDTHGRTSDACRLAALEAER